MKGKNIREDKALKIIVPIALLCVVVAIWFIKNNRELIDSSGSDNTAFALHTTKKIDLEELKSHGVPIIIDFGADSCLPCKEMAPVLKELNEELRGKAIIKFVDVWKYQDLTKGYPIDLIPTQIFIDAKGKPYNPKNPEAMQMNLYSRKDTGEHVFTTHEGGMSKEQLLTVLKEMGMK
jgi:thioredoxin 1